MPHRKEERVLVPPPRVNRGQLTCVSARYAQEETPAIAHFAGVHHHTDQILRTVGVNDRTDWMLRNIDRVRRDLDVLGPALQAGEFPDLTERDSLPRLQTAFEGIPAGLRQPLDASRGWRDCSRAYRPDGSTDRRSRQWRRLNRLLAGVIALVILNYIAYRT
ncbi:hypothetical protein AB0M58_14155 [Streptomyces bobili]|uniref:hypothetical protein n=1 Tax=Streptomyces bobili TaxID=67280 RepID=UPI003430A82B